MDDGGIGAFGGRTKGDEIEDLSHRRRAAQDFLVDKMAFWYSLTRQCRLVECRLAGQDHIVDRQNLAAADHQPVA